VEQQQNYEDESFLQANMMGDIRDDIKFLGLEIKDIWWIIGTTTVLGGFTFALPIPIWFKLSWAGLILVLSFVARLAKWPFRLFRNHHYLRTPKQGEGASLGDLLGIEEDGWSYRSDQMMHIVLSVTALPWSTATMSAKRQRLGAFENFLRACSREDFEASFSSEMINDFRHELWNKKELSLAVSPGISKLKQQRLEMWRELASTGEAQRSEYTLRLSIPQYTIPIRERDDEPLGATKKELERFRIVAELREKLQRTMSSLVSTGHTWSIVSGFATTELVSRWWDRTAWEEWKSLEGDWLDEADIVFSADEVVNTLLTMIDEQPSMEEVNHIQGEGEQVVVHESWMDEAVSELTSDEKRNEITVIHEEDKPISSESAPEDKKKENDRLRWMKQLSVIVAQRSKKEFQKVNDWFSKLKNKKPSQQTKQLQSIITAINVSGEEEKTNGQDIRSAKFEGIYYVTSPVSTGKSFTVTNMGVAHSSSEQKIHLVDLSRDRGCHSLINPLSTPSEVQGWDCWYTPHAAHLFLWTPNRYPEISTLQEQLLTWSKEGVVFVELPYDYPERDLLLSIGCTVGVVDNDYHHWLQWEKQQIKLDMIWMNQTDQKMKKSFISLVQEKFEKEPVIYLPHFHDAAWWSFQGRPLAAQPKVKMLFQLDGNGSDEEVQV
jgi:hypothetical protein